MRSGRTPTAFRRPSTSTTWGASPSAPRSSLASEFTRRVLSAVRRIPPGKVATYGDIAELAGRPGASRAVGTIMRTSREQGLPYHRVIAAGGALGGYTNLNLKRGLLRAEGIDVGERRVRRFDAVRWRPRASGSARGRRGPI